MRLEPDRIGAKPEILRASVSVPLGRVAEWQTRTVQVRVSVRTWGFNSPLAHNRLPSPAALPALSGFCPVWAVWVSARSADWPSSRPARAGPTHMLKQLRGVRGRHR